jgi:uncharacterized membrane protein
MEQDPPASPSAHDEPLDQRLFAIVGLILTLLSVLFVVALWTVQKNYNKGMTIAVAQSCHVAILSYARGLDAAFIKTSALYLGFLLVFTGALYVLRIATAHYRLNVKSGKHSGSLDTSSPGLVIITLGVVLIIVTLMTRSTLDFQDHCAGRPASANDTSAKDTNAKDPAADGQSSDGKTDIYRFKPKPLKPSH